MTRPNTPRVLFLVTESRYFWLHRAGLARSLRARGFEVFVMARASDPLTSFANEGFKFVEWRNFTRGSLNPIREVGAFTEVLRAYRRTRPHIVHHFGIKPILHGGLAMRLIGHSPAVHSVTGRGSVFTLESIQMQLLRSAIRMPLRAALGGNKSAVIFQNSNDLEAFVHERVIAPQRAILIRGSGVDVIRFAHLSEPDGIPIILFAARLLWEKGVGEFVQAARQLRERHVNARFVITGAADPENPSSVPQSQLQAWASDRTVEWWGQRGDMPDVLARSSVVCLPSAYGEGVPKILIEAAACGRPVIASDIPGCRDIVRNGENGILIAPKNAEALASAIQFLLSDAVLRKRMGARSREIACREFAEDLVIEQTLSVYKKLLPDCPILNGNGRGMET